MKCSNLTTSTSPTPPHPTPLVPLPVNFNIRREHTPSTLRTKHAPIYTPRLSRTRRAPEDGVPHVSPAFLCIMSRLDNCRSTLRKLLGRRLTMENRCCRLCRWEFHHSRLCLSHNDRRAFTFTPVRFLELIHYMYKTQSQPTE